MPSIEVPLALYRMDMTFQVVYAVYPTTRASTLGPEDVGLEIQSVTCVEVKPLFSAAWPPEKLDAMGTFLRTLFWSAYTGDAIQRLCWSDWAARREAAREARAGV